MGAAPLVAMAGWSVLNELDHGIGARFALL
jgi:hypothetical protein